jgi:hypothetical protein
MIAPNLVLKYMIDGDNRVHIRGAVRIRVDGCGALTVYHADGGKSESVSLGCLRSLSIQTVADTSPCIPSMIQ